MKSDNQWHEAICVEHADGNFGIYDDIADADKNGKGKFASPVKFQDVKYNWNRGQPIVDFGDFKMTITDIGFVPVTTEAA